MDSTASKKRLFLAAPLSTAEQRRFNRAVADAVGEVFSVFLPQRDVGLLEEFRRRGLSEAEARRAVFERDMEGLRAADVVLAVLDGPLVTGGVAVELGVAYALGKRCVGLYSPHRRLRGGATSPIIEGALSEVFEGVEQLRAWVMENFRTYEESLLSTSRLNGAVLHTTLPMARVPTRT